MLLLFCLFTPFLSARITHTLVKKQTHLTTTRLVIIYFAVGIIFATSCVIFITEFTALSSVALLLLTIIAFVREFLVCWDPPVKEIILHLTPSQHNQSSAATTCSDGKLPKPSSKKQIKSGTFYKEYHSHKIKHLVTVKRALEERGCKQFIYLCGDSSLDNKHWFFDPFKIKSKQMNNSHFTAPAINEYEAILKEPSRMVMDVSYHLNKQAEERFGSGSVCTIMSSIEESTIADRASSPTGLLLQDHFIRDTIQPTDSLIVSVGGNDIALNPSIRTVINMALLLHSPSWMIRYGIAPGFGYFVKMFHAKIQEFVLNIIDKNVPQNIIICMIYYPSQERGGWADDTLQKLGYNERPEKLQFIIRCLFEAIKKKGFPKLVDSGTKVIPFPLYQVLTENKDYVQRVEPSVQGGRKMALAFMDALFGVVH